MNLYLTLLMCILSLGITYAQYDIDLSKKIIPKIKYLDLGNPGPKGKEIRINNLYLEESGIPKLPVMGEIHYNRMNQHYWRDALLKMKSSGINIVSTYCLWNLHEEIEGELSWNGRNDLHRFVEICKELGLKVHLRIGPYCNAEIKNGGLPEWIINNKNFESRSNDSLYLEYVKKWYKGLYNQVRGLFHKDGGPIIAVQLENEYVKRGMIVSHLTQLKKIAVEIGFDVPLYSMTHWMDSEYPKGEIVPYAGFYIEAPWTTSGKDEISTSNFEFYTYNRLSDNIGTDIIKIEGEVESLSGENNESPFFTCEVGVGTTSFYHRRAVVPEEMAGEIINLRLGCGANMMGYYMYAGGTNPVGKRTTMQSSGPRISYDYQAPIREFGTLGDVMPEVKKYNYFMNDFGTELAPAIAYLPTTNQNHDNLQWAVRYDGNKGYLFCSNYLYKHERQDFDKVQFKLKLDDEVIKIPREKVHVKGGTYFLWPFNQLLDGILLKYSTTQPICTFKNNNSTTFFFFEDDFIPAEYLIDGNNIKSINVNNALCKKEEENYFLNKLNSGKNCVIEMMKTDGSIVRIVTLTEEESDCIWKEHVNGKDFVALTSSSLIVDNNRITIIDNSPHVSVSIFDNGVFKDYKFSGEERNIKCNIRKLSPMSNSFIISPKSGNEVQRDYNLYTCSEVEKAFLRYSSLDNIKCKINDNAIKTKNFGEYCWADVTSYIKKGRNNCKFFSNNIQGIASEIEILLKNGSRILWNTDGTWTSSKLDENVNVLKKEREPFSYSPEEHLAIYEVNVPEPIGICEETRMYISYYGDVANLYQSGHLVADSYYDGSDWIVSIDRLMESAEVNPLIIRIDGLKSKDEHIYFEKNIDVTKCIDPSLSSIKIKQEYRFNLLK